MKGYTELRGIERLRTMHTTKQRSIPRMQRSVEIELYLLQKERERFLKEAYKAKHRYESILDRIKNIDEEIDRQELTYKQKQDSLKPLLGDWKTKKMNY